MFMTMILYDFVCNAIYESEFNKNNTSTYDLVMTDLRERIQYEIDKRGWTPTILAEKSGVPQPTIQRFLSGTHGEPRGYNIKKIAAGLGLTEAELRGFTSSPAPAVRGEEPIDIAGLMPLASPATQDILQTLERGLKEGRLSRDDIKLLETIAKRLIDDKSRKNR
jgi:transcriptional regulator with XRE-family HTH domain